MTEWCTRCGYNRAEPGRRKCAGCRSREWRNTNPGKQSDLYQKNRLNRFGVDEFWYNQRLAEQNGVCAICKRPETVKRNGKLLPLGTTAIPQINHGLCFARGVIVVSVYLGMTRRGSKQLHDICGNTQARPTATVMPAR